MISTFSDPVRGMVDPITLDASYNPPLRGFVVTGAGNVQCVFVDGTIGIWPAVAAGDGRACLISTVTSDNTTATEIKGVR